MTLDARLTWQPYVKTKVLTLEWIGRYSVYDNVLLYQLLKSAIEEYKNVRIKYMGRLKSSAQMVMEH